MDAVGRTQKHVGRERQEILGGLLEDGAIKWKPRPKTRNVVMLKLAHGGFKIRSRPRVFAQAPVENSMKLDPSELAAVRGWRGIDR